MRLKLILRLFMLALFFAPGFAGFSQTVPDAYENVLPFALGGGVAAFNPDLGGGHILGITIWGDYFPTWTPRILGGWGLEVEGRDLSMGRSPSVSSAVREDMAGGGVIYNWRRFHSFRPYAKGLGGIANADFPVTPTFRGHQNRGIIVLGGGIEARLFRAVWVRGDYEYQIWPAWYYSAVATHGAGFLTPQGITLGASYHFNQIHTYFK